MENVNDTSCVARAFAYVCVCVCASSSAGSLADKTSLKDAENEKRALCSVKRVHIRMLGGGYKKSELNVFLYTV